jgi:hypothetical protein
MSLLLAQAIKIIVSKKNYNKQKIIVLMINIAYNKNK